MFSIVVSFYTFVEMIINNNCLPVAGILAWLEFMCKSMGTTGFSLIVETLLSTFILASSEGDEGPDGDDVTDGEEVSEGGGLSGASDLRPA